MSRTVKLIASLVDGRVVPWYSTEDPIPAKFVVVPPALQAKHASGEITDGIVLARAALAENGELGVAPQNVATPKPAKADAVEPGSVDPSSVEQGTPTSETTHFPRKGGTMRA